jgi:ParB-like nuclease domain
LSNSAPAPVSVSNSITSGADIEGYPYAKFAPLRTEASSNADVNNTVGGYLYLRTTSLKPDPRNPRVHTEKQVRQIDQSIESFGFNVPLLIDDQQQVIAGHGRLKAVRKLGWDTVPAIRLNHLTESQRMAFLIADNRLTENSSRDEPSSAKR